MNSRANVVRFLLGYFFGTANPLYAIIVLHLRDVGFSFTEIAGLWIVFAAIVLICELPSGVLADFWGRRNTVVLSHLFVLAASLMLAVASSWTDCAIGFALWGAGFACVSGARDAWIFDSLKQARREDEYLRIKGKLQLLHAASLVSASIVGGWMFSLEPILPFVLFLMCRLIAAVAWSVLDEPPRDAPVEAATLGSTARHLRDAASTAWNRPLLRWLIIFSAVSYVPASAFTEIIVQPLLAEDGYDPTRIGWIIGLAVVSGHVAASGAYRWAPRLGRSRTLWVVAAAAPILYACAGAGISGAAVPIALLIYALVDSEEIVIDSYVHHATSSRRRATVLSLQNQAAGLLQIVAFAGVGVLIDRTSLHTALISFAVLLAFVNVFLLRSRPRSLRD